MLNHRGTKTLFTSRLILRPFTTDDARDMYENWACDDRVTRFLSWQPHQNIAETIKLLEAWCAEYDHPNTYNWVMEYDNKAIGNISVVRLNNKREWAELGYCMGHAYWNRGLMTEATKAIINYLFCEIGLHRIEISHAVLNPASGKVAQKCGLSYEGTKRESFKNHAGEFLDVAYYGILSHEHHITTNR